MFRKHVTRQMSEFLHGELSAGEKLRVEAHLRECARCRAVHDEIRQGDALETNASSEAQVKIADIGQLTIAPNTRIRLLVTRPDEHRIALDRGKVEALTIAPPRLFIVDTPAATAIDLGCKYTLEVG